MKLTIASDLHLEHHRDGGKQFLAEFAYNNTDVLVLAGDIFNISPWNLETAENIIQNVCSKWKDVVFVPGNHCFYGTSLTLGHKHLQEFAKKYNNFHYLHTGVVKTIQKQRFLGDTMWFPRSDAPKWLNDFKLIKEFEPEVYKHHKKFKNWLEDEIKEGDVVVTHHAPSNKSIASAYAGDECNDYFVVPYMEDLITVSKPKLWGHGHVHGPFDYRINKTRVYCNPKGYIREDANPEFWDRLVVEI